MKKSERPGLETIPLPQAARPVPGNATFGVVVVIAGTPADLGCHKVIQERLTIGREGNDFHLRDTRSSRRHAEVTQIGAAFMLQDVGSTNGTLVNGQKIRGATPLADGDKITIGQTQLKFSLVDQTEASYLQRMEQMAGTDELTGLIAKHRFDVLLAEAAAKSVTEPHPLALMMLDMDGLKAMNDRYGHQMGEHAIRCVGNLLGELTNGRGEATRFGGDEFCLYLEGASLDEAQSFAEQVRTQIAALEVELDGTRATVTASIGIAMRDEVNSSPKLLLGAADQALYRAKEAGRNRFAL